MFNIFPEIVSKENVRLSRNNTSCVLKVTSSYGSVLLPGDIERDAEHYLVEKYKENLSVDTLVVAHHGSRTSSTPVFLNAVNPKHAVISAAYFSPYGHPHRNVQQRLEKYSNEVLSTAVQALFNLFIQKMAFSSENLEHCILVFGILSPSINSHKI